MAGFCLNNNEFNANKESLYWLSNYQLLKEDADVLDLKLTSMLLLVCSHRDCKKTSVNPSYPSSHQQAKVSLTFCFADPLELGPTSMLLILCSYTELRPCK
jgi:hypothetical protein